MSTTNVAQSVVFTGTLCSKSRKEAEAEAEAAGYKVDKSMKSSTTYLVVGGTKQDKDTKKLADARKLGVTVLSEAEWSDQVGGGAKPRLKKAPSSDVEIVEDRPAKPAARVTKRKAPEPDDEIEICDDDDNQPKRTASKPPKPVNPTKQPAPPPPPAATTAEPPTSVSAFDPATAAINGIRPLVLLADGEERQVQGSGASPYTLKRVLDHYTCSCPAWRNQRLAPTVRTCKHLKALLGEAYEAARASTPASAAPARTSSQAPRAAAVTKAGAPKLLLAHKWERDRHDPVGWWISEKLDGVRAFWDCKKRMLISRLGNEFPAPAFFTSLLPGDVDLDGEIYGGRGKFQFTVGVAKTQGSPHWSSLCFRVFDAPSMASDTFERRIEALKKLAGSWDPKYNQLVEHTKCSSLQHLDEVLADVERQGGEGLMIRQPGSKYVGAKSTTLLKIKGFLEGDALVIGHEAGKGKYAGMVGALKCKMQSGKTFKVSSGLTDAQRDEPPAVGCIINYKCQEMTDGGVPRFPVFLGECVDKEGPTDPVGRAGEAEEDDEEL